MSDTPTRRSYTFGGDTGMTQDELNARRRIIAALSTSQKTAPKNVGEGLHAIGKALATRMMMSRLREDQLGFNRMNEAWFDADLEEFGPKPVPTGGVPQTPPGYSGAGSLLGEFRGTGGGGGTTSMPFDPSKFLR